MFIIYLNLLRALFGTQLSNLAVPIVRLMTQCQISTFLEEVFQLLALVLSAELANLLVVLSKQSKVLPGSEKGSGRAISQRTNMFSDLPYSGSNGGKWIACDWCGCLFEKPCLAKINQ